MGFGVILHFANLCVNNFITASLGRMPRCRSPEVPLRISGLSKVESERKITQKCGSDDGASEAETGMRIDAGISSDWRNGVCS